MRERVVLVDFYLLVSTITLTIQLVTFALLLIGYNLKRQKRYRQHGLLMVAAVVLHLISVFAIMIPSFEAIAFTVTNLAQTDIYLAYIHAILGSIALVLGIWLTVSWRLRQGLQYCAPKKRFMLVTFGVWTAAILIGIVLYFLFYMPLMV